MYIYSKVVPCILSQLIKINCNSSWKTNKNETIRLQIELLIKSQRHLCCSLLPLFRQIQIYFYQVSVQLSFETFFDISVIITKPKPTKNAKMKTTSWKRLFKNLQKILKISIFYFALSIWNDIFKILMYKYHMWHGI